MRSFPFLDVRHRLLVALRQAVPAGLPIVKAADKDAVDFYTANDIVTTCLGDEYPLWNSPACTSTRLPTAGREPKRVTLKPIGGL